MRFKTPVAVFLLCLFFAYAGTTHARYCAWDGSDKPCRNANFGQTCTKNGQVGQCTADGAEPTTCSCMTASSRRSTQQNKSKHRCSAGKRWSPVKSRCIKPLAKSPDGRHSCGTWNGYFFDPDTNVCTKLFE